MRDLETLLTVLACSRCHTAPLVARDEGLRCPSCGHTYDSLKGVPVMWPEPGEVRLVEDDHVSNPIPDRVLDWLESLDGYSLNLGAGATARPLPRCIEGEYAVFRNTDVVIDAHHLPFPDGFFDAVVSFNTFEHLARPAAAAAEIHRVLKPGGRVVLETAFLQPVHEAPFHFYNATEFGVRNWFSSFDIQSCEVPDNLSPAVSLAWLAMEILHAVGLDQGWTRSEQLAATTLAQWRQLWVDPDARHGLLWDTVNSLPPEARAGLAAGFQLDAIKPAQE